MMNLADNPHLHKTDVSRSTFYQGDCLVEMDKIADKSVDMILCDLPYGTTACKWDSVIPFEPLWKQYERVIKDNGAIVLTASQPFTSALVMSNTKLFKYEMIWNKCRGTNPGIAKYRPMPSFENILVFGKRKLKYNPQFREGEAYCKKSGVAKRGGNSHKMGFHTVTITDNSGFRYPLSVIDVSYSPTTTIHPTQKPVELMEYLIKTYTNEGETVLDNCMGSGSTGVACKKTGRHFIGIEKDEKYFERVSSHMIVSASKALYAMQTKAHDLGLSPRIYKEAYMGHAHDLAREFLDEVQPGQCLLAAGESTVELGANSGAGGRNLEMALAALSLVGEKRVLLAIDSDGYDNTSFAGAIVDSNTVTNAKRLGLNVQAELNSHNSYLFFEAVGDYVETGLTGANVADLVVVLSEK